MAAVRFTQTDLHVSLRNEGRDYNQNFQTYKFYFSMRMTFANEGDTTIFVGDLLNLYGESLDEIFDRVFRHCTNGVNLQHFNRNTLVDTDFVQFTLEHTDFVDYVFSSRNVKYSDLRYDVLTGGVMNWLNNLAQSNRQMDIDNDWAISIQVSRTSETPRGFGKTDDVFEPEIVPGEELSPDKEHLSVKIPRLSEDKEMNVLPPDDDDEEERLFGPMTDEEEEVVSDSLGEDDYYDEDDGMLNDVFKNQVALNVLMDTEIKNSSRIRDYYDLGRAEHTELKGECLLISIYVHHLYLTQPKNFKRIMNREGSWITPRFLSRLMEFSKKLKEHFGENPLGRGHWNEVSYICGLCAGDTILLSDPPKTPIAELRKENSNVNSRDYPTYVLMHYNETKNTCKIKKLFSCGDNGIFSNDKPCVLLLKNNHFYNVFGHNFLFCDVDTPHIGVKRKRGSLSRYKKSFCLRCMVSYSNDYLHVCLGRCPRCLSSNDSHHNSGQDDFEEERVCQDCGRKFLHEYCYVSHKATKLKGEHASYCSFLCTLLNCDDCRQDFSLSLRCRHFGKKKRAVQSNNVFFSNNDSSARLNHGASKYVKCGYCSEFYIKGFSGNHYCFLKRTDSIFGDEKKRSATIHAHNVFFYDIESRLEERFECRFQVPNARGELVTVRKSCMLNTLTEIEKFKESLPDEHMNCLEVVKCRSHQPTLLCVREFVSIIEKTLFVKRILVT